MKKLFLFTTLLHFSIAGKAQDFEGDVRHIVDSLLQVWKNDSTNALGIPANDTFYFARLEDSLTRAFVLNYFNAEVAKGEYSWPFWYFQNTDDTSIRYPNPTQQYLLRNDYGIKMDGVSNGCVWQWAFVFHDSLMYEAVRAKFGKNFFWENAKRAADLDASGQGLQLPRIRGSKPTADVLKQAFAYADTARKDQWEYGPQLYLVMEFHGDSVANAYWGKDFLGSVQFDIDRFYSSGELLEQVRRLGWTGPRFRRKPAAKSVVFDFENKSLRFQ